MRSAFGQAASSELPESKMAAAAVPSAGRLPSSESGMRPAHAGAVAAGSQQQASSGMDYPAEGLRVQLAVRSAPQIQLQRGDRRAMSGSLVEGGVMRSAMWGCSKVLVNSDLQDHARRAALAAADEAEVAASQAAASAAAKEVKKAGEQPSPHPSCPNQPKLNPAAEPWRSPISQLTRRPSSIAGV